MQLGKAPERGPDPADEAPGQRAHGASISIHACLALALAATAVFFYSRELHLAGLADDDARTAMWTYSAVEGFPCHDFSPDVVIPHFGRLSFSLHIFPYTLFAAGNHWLPLAYCPYMGPWTVYTFAPFLAIADRTLAIRAYVLAWSGFAAVSVYAAAFVLGESLSLAVLAGLAAAAWPFMCEAVLSGYSCCGIIAVPLAMAGLALLAYASRRRSLKAWYASCAAVGLGMGFFVQCAAFFVAWALGSYWLRDRLSGAWRKDRLVTGKSAGLLLLGNLPLLATNVLWPWPRWVTLDFLIDHLAVSANDVRNADYLGNLLTRVKEVYSIFGDSPLWIILLAAAALAQVLALMQTHRDRNLEKEAFLPSLYFLVMLLLSPLTLSSLGTYHIVALFPFAVLSLAALPRLFPFRGKSATLACAALLATGLAANVAGLRSFWARAEEGKLALVNPRLEALADWLARANPPEVVSITPGAPPPTLSWLTRDRIRAREWVIVRSRHYPPGEFAQLADAVRVGSPAFFVSDSQTDPIFRRLCARNARRLELLQDFPDTAQPGRISVYRLAPLLKSKGRS